MLLKGEVGDHALNSHGNYIVDHGKSWNCVFEFLWEPCFKNVFSCQYLADILFHCIVCVISLLLLISGDVHPNPGPNVSLDTSTSSSCRDIPGRDLLNIMHLNIQSLYPKHDIFEVVLTDSWLSPNKKHRIL